MATAAGEGPNYPAAFGGSGSLLVLGVGATDQEDNVAPFSGGKRGHTDVYAPGVDIYSAFAEDGYAVGSGTSMSATFVSGEAALLIAQHPGWDALKVSETIAKKTARVRSGGGEKKNDKKDENVPGRIDLAAALGNEH